jgi:hypothetical protein
MPLMQPLSCSGAKSLGQASLGCTTTPIFRSSPKIYWSTRKASYRPRREGCRSRVVVHGSHALFRFPHFVGLPIENIYSSLLLPHDYASKMSQLAPTRTRYALHWWRISLRVVTNVCLIIAAIIGIVAGVKCGNGADYSSSDYYYYYYTSYIDCWPWLSLPFVSQFVISFLISITTG